MGSEGTLVTILEAKVTLVYNHPERVLLLIGYKDIYEAGDHIPEILPFGPIGLEGLDHRLRDNVQVKGGPHRKYLPMLPGGNGWLMVEFGCDTQEEAVEQAHKLMEALKSSSILPWI